MSCAERSLNLGLGALKGKRNTFAMMSSAGKFAMSSRRIALFTIPILRAH